MAKTRAKNPPGKRYGISLLATIILIGCIAISLIMRQGEVLSARRQMADLEAQIKYYQAATEALLQQKEMLTTDDYIEKAAREKLGLVMPGEVQYMLLEYDETFR